MANGDPLRVGLTQPPDNRATSATMLVHTGSAFGTQTSSFWVRRAGSPIGTSAIRGENFSTGTKAGQTVAGVMGMIQAPGGDVGVLGAASGQPNVMWGEIGVMGVTNSFGVVGKGLGGLVEEGGEIITSSVGVLGESNGGVGVQGVATSGFGVIGRSTSRAGVTGTSQSSAGVEGESVSGVGVLGESARAVGVWGVTSGFAAVRGSATQGYGVLAESTQGVAVLGQSPTNAIRGVSNGPAAASIGVVGISDLGNGVQGLSTQGGGGWFSGRTGVVGVSDPGYAVVGKSSQGLAGLFLGRVLIERIAAGHRREKRGRSAHGRFTPRALLSGERREHVAGFRRGDSQGRVHVRETGGRFRAANPRRRLSGVPDRLRAPRGPCPQALAPGLRDRPECMG